MPVLHSAVSGWFEMVSFQAAPDPEPGTWSSDGTSSGCARFNKHIALPH